MAKITLTGNVPAKKNQKQIIYVRGKPIIIPSKNYKKWHSQVLPQLSGKRPVQSRIKGIELIFYPDSKRKFDLTNKAESVMDLLVDAGIIEDDNYSVVPKLTIQFGSVDKDNPHVEIYVDTGKETRLLRNAKKSDEKMQ